MSKELEFPPPAPPPRPVHIDADFQFQEGRVYLTFQEGLELPCKHPLPFSTLKMLLVTLLTHEAAHVLKGAERSARQPGRPPIAPE